MTAARFIVLSAALAAVVTAGVSILLSLGGLVHHPVIAVAAGFAGFLVSTSGWMVVLRGFESDPERAPVFFGIGMLVKLGLVAMLGVALMVSGRAFMREFLTVFAAVFVPLGFAQLALVIKQAGNGAGRENGG